VLPEAHEHDASVQHDAVEVPLFDVPPEAEEPLQTAAALRGC
jgi:hypothetical protein